MAKLNIKETYEKEIVPALQEKFSYKNKFSICKLEKIIIHRGLGEATVNPKSVDVTYDQFYRITGQRPVLTRSKKAISNFKLRENQIIGCKVTLRSDKMYDFLAKFVQIVLPKIRDFRGVPVKGFDGNGNYNLGIKEDLIFPEVDFNKHDKMRGMDITFVTTSSNDEECKALLSLFGMPFVDRKVQS